MHRQERIHTEHEVERRFILNIVVRERATFIELFPHEHEAPFVRDVHLVLDLLFQTLDGVRRLDVDRNRYAYGALPDPVHGKAKERKPSQMSALGCTWRREEDLHVCRLAKYQISSVSPLI